MMLVLHKKGKILGVYKGARVEGGNVIGPQGEVLVSGLSAEYTYVPDQDLSHLKRQTDDGDIVWTGVFPDDIPLLPSRSQQIDMQTEEAINREVHPLAPVGEQIAILRDQLVHVLNALGVEPTEEFARLNNVAIAAIQEGQKEKEALVEGNATG